MENEELPKIVELKDNKETPDSFSYKSIVLISATIIFILLTVGAAAYMISSSNKQVLQSDNIPISIVPSSAIEPTVVDLSTPLTQSLVTPTPIILANKYINSTYDFSFRYPGDWEVKGEASQDSRILLFLILSPSIEGSVNTPITLSYSTRSYDEVVTLKNQPVETITIGDLEAGRRVIKDSDGNIFIQVIIAYDDNSFVFLAREKYKKTLDNILPTFLLKI